MTTIHQRILDLIDSTPCQGLDSISTAELQAFRDRIDNAPAAVSLQWNTVRAYAAAGGELHRRDEIRQSEDRAKLRRRLGAS